MCYRVKSARSKTFFCPFKKLRLAPTITVAEANFAEPNRHFATRPWHTLKVCKFRGLFPSVIVVPPRSGLGNDLTLFLLSPAEEAGKQANQAEKKAHTRVSLKTIFVGSGANAPGDINTGPWSLAVLSGRAVCVEVGTFFRLKRSVCAPRQGIELSSKGTKYSFTGRQMRHRRSPRTLPSPPSAATAVLRTLYMELSVELSAYR